MAYENEDHKNHIRRWRSVFSLFFKTQVKGSEREKETKNEPVIKVQIVSLPKETHKAQTYYKLSQWLTDNHVELFAKQGSINNNYVAALPPNNGGKKPELYFFDKKEKVIEFLKDKPQGVYEYRFSDGMELMY
ncbi:MAG: hypothetical protein ABR969_06260 [Sedimentisphaerales bacterium]|jgi:hypothetical protein